MAAGVLGVGVVREVRAMDRVGAEAVTLELVVRMAALGESLQGLVLAGVILNPLYILEGAGAMQISAMGRTRIAGVAVDMAVAEQQSMLHILGVEVVALAVVVRMAALGQSPAPPQPMPRQRLWR